MPFGLKNDGATYQRMATTFLHDMIHKEIEVYVDDMMVKSLTREGHFEALDKFLSRTEKYNLILNPKKCVFGVTSRKLLGHIVIQKGIKVDPDKVKEIKELGSHDMFIAEVVGVTVDDKYMNENGKFELNSSKLVTYSHGEYFGLGKKIGKFGYSVKKN